VGTDCQTNTAENQDITGIEPESEYDHVVPLGEEDKGTPDEEYDLDVVLVKILQQVGKVTRSFTAIPDKLQRLCFVAKE